MKNLEWLHELAALKGGKCLSVEYINAKSEYEWECGKCGHRWWATADNVSNSNSWCPKCAIRKRAQKQLKDINWLHELAAKRGGRCLSVEYINSHTKYEWECDKGHGWKASAEKIQQGRWCPKCSVQKRVDKKRKCIDWLHKLAIERGGKCLSTKYINNHTKYNWECDKGHGWEATAHNISAGNWCPECSNCKKRDTNWLHQLASQRNGRCLSTEYINNQAKYKWECSRGHRWEATANSIQQGQWCPECAGNVKKDIYWLHELAAQMGGKCLSTEYINSGTKYEWECDKGHGWEAMAGHIRDGHWCPYCIHRHSGAELQLFEFIKQLYPDTVNGQRKILLNPRFELDIYIPSLQKAIEFDGEFWHSRPESQARDLRKNQECEAKGIKLLRIGEQDFLDNPQQVFDIVKDFLNNKVP